MTEHRAKFKVEGMPADAEIEWALLPPKLRNAIAFPSTPTISTVQHACELNMSLSSLVLRE